MNFMQLQLAKQIQTTIIVLLGAKRNYNIEQINPWEGFL